MPALHTKFRFRGNRFMWACFPPAIGLLLVLARGNLGAHEKWPAFDRFRAIASQNVPEGLLVLADERAASPDLREQHTSLLTRTLAAFRPDELSTTLSQLDSLLSHVPANEFSIRATAHQFLPTTLTMLVDPERGLEVVEAGLLEMPSTGYVLERIALMNDREVAMLVDGRDLDAAFDAFDQSARFSVSVESAWDEAGAEHGMGLIRLNQRRFP